MINPFFYSTYYLATNLDLQRAGLHAPPDLWHHYLTHGAQETPTTNSHRQPNAWFNLNYYLQTHPDLLTAGITAPQALNHYYQFGLDEGRHFSPTLSASDFNAETYAADHTDLRHAFGITTPSELSPTQKNQLLKHYLAFGYLENRSGAGEMAQTVQADLVINVNTLPNTPGDSHMGTVMNDRFVIESGGKWVVSVADITLNGLGGEDTVVIGAGVNTGVLHAAAPMLSELKLRHIEHVHVSEQADGPVAFSSSQPLTSLTVSADVAITAGAAIAHVINHAATVNPIALEAGQSTVQLTAAVNTQLNLNHVKGSAISVHLLAESNNNIDITLGSVGSPMLGTVVLDASATTGGVGLHVESSIAAVMHTQMMAGRGADRFYFDNGAATVRVDGRGEQFTAVDSISGFRAGDALVLAGMNDPPPLVLLSVASGELAGLTLEQVVMHERVVDHSLFTWQQDSYVVVKKGAVLADVELIQLHGVSANQLVEWGAVIGL